MEKICESYICKEKFENKYLKDKKYRKVRYNCQWMEKWKRNYKTYILHITIY